MRQGLTSRLAKLVMVSLFCTFGIPLQAAEPVEFASDESANYLAELRRLYLTGSDRQALLAHSNGLLGTYALRAGFQIGQPNPQDVLYELSVATPGTIPALSWTSAVPSAPVITSPGTSPRSVPRLTGRSGTGTPDEVRLAETFTWTVLIPSAGTAPLPAERPRLTPKNFTFPGGADGSGTTFPSLEGSMATETSAVMSSLLDGDTRRQDALPSRSVGTTGPRSLPAVVLKKVLTPSAGLPSGPTTVAEIKAVSAPVAKSSSGEMEKV